MTIKEVSKRYEISEASAKARIRFLDLDVSNISDDDFDRLDALAEHLKEGNAITTFNYTPTASVEVVQTTSKLVPTSKEPTPDAPQAPSIQFGLRDLKEIYTFLQLASDQHWHLPSSVIRSVTGSTPKGKRWKRFGFAFEPATKHGTEKAWAVSQAEWDFPPD